MYDELKRDIDVIIDFMGLSMEKFKEELMNNGDAIYFSVYIVKNIDSIQM